MSSNKTFKLRGIPTTLISNKARRGSMENRRHHRLGEQRYYFLA